MDPFAHAKNIVEKRGAAPIYAKSQYCEWWKKNHLDCKECESELGCTKVAKLMALWAFASANPPTSPAEYQRLAENIKSLEEKILQAKNLQELLTISDTPI